MRVKDKFGKCEWKLRTTLQCEVVNGADRSTVLNRAGMETAVKETSCSKVREMKWLCGTVQFVTENRQMSTRKGATW